MSGKTRKIYHKWEQADLSAVAEKYESRSDFANSEPAAYRAAKRMGDEFFEKICEHMISKPRKKEKWTFDAIVDVAKNYENVDEFKRNESVAYQKVIKKSWKEELIKTLGDSWAISKRRSRTVDFSFEKIVEIAKNYTEKSEFVAKERSAYNKALNNGWIDEICAHMKQRVSWSQSKVIEEAKKYSSYTEFTKKSASAQRTAYRMGIIDTHIKPLYD